jgi:hypothetical protein
MQIRVEIAAGELIDKITILEIKRERIADPAKRANVETELAVLTAAFGAAAPQSPELQALTAELKAVNARLWDIEDEIRDLERAGRFDARFVAVARSVYRTNDERAAIKRRINDLLGSRLVEEKSYARY